MNWPAYRGRRRIGIVFRFSSALATLVIVASFNAYGFGMGTHAYVAWRVCGTPWLEVAYAAMAPDCFQLASSDAVKTRMQHMTHFEFDRLAPTPFAIGFATHNGEWGADHYAHCYYDPLAPDTYFTARMRQLSDEFGFSINKGEDVIEGILDYMLRRDFDVWWGEFLTAAAHSCGPSQDRQLVDAFALPLSQSVSGLTLEQAQSTVRSVASGYRWAMGIYGDQLATNELPYIWQILVGGMANDLDIEEAEAEQVLIRAEELCQDYRTELDAIAVSVRNELQTTVYTLPACGILPLMFTLAGSALVCLLKRRD